MGDLFILFYTDNGPTLLRRSSIERVIGEPDEGPRPALFTKEECTVLLRSGFADDVHRLLVKHHIKAVLKMLNPPLDIPDTTYSVDMRQEKESLSGRAPSWVGTIKAVTK